MPRLEYFLVCRSVMKDLNTDEITFAHVLEDVFLDAKPHIIRSAVAISVWNIEAEDTKVDYQATLVVKVPGYADVSFPMNFSGGRHRYRAVQVVQDIPLHQPGALQFEVKLNGQHSATHTVTVHPPGVRERDGSLQAFQ
jgi:hypothetical protein